MEYSPKYDHELSEGIKRVVALIYKQRGPLDTAGLTYFDANTFRISEDNTRGDLHVRTVSSYQNLGKPVAGNFFYVDPYHINTENTDQGGPNSICVSHNDCKQMYQCIRGTCIPKPSENNEEEVTKSRPGEVLGELEYPENCKMDHDCILHMEWYQEQDGYIRFRVEVRSEVKRFELSFTNEISTGISDLWIFEADGTITDGYIKKYCILISDTNCIL